MAPLFSAVSRGRELGPRPSLMKTLRATGVWTERGLLPDHTVVVGDDGVITGVRPSIPSDGPAADGWLVPGLVNAHTHIERTGPIAPGGKGLAAWVDGSVGPEGDAEAGAAELHTAGTAVVSDISNSGDTGEALDAANITGVIQYELLGHDPSRVREALQFIEGFRERGPLAIRPTAHGPHSTAPDVLIASMRAPSAHPASIHVAEHRDESDYLLNGGGPFAQLLAKWGVDTSRFAPPGTSAIQYLAALDLLGPMTLAVHCVDTDMADMEALVESQTPVCVCPRSSLHIGGEFADIKTLLKTGATVVLGTDGRGSSPNLDILGEFPALYEAAPLLPLTWALAACTHIAANALGFPAYGRLRPGLSPGVLLLHGIRRASDLATPPPREWLVQPGIAAGALS
jgi:cytosine/adenosine deaminase-related metal-dependent hydrolase